MKIVCREFLSTVFIAIPRFAIVVFVQFPSLSGSAIGNGIETICHDLVYLGACYSWSVLRATDAAA